MKVSVKNTDVLACLLTEHSRITFLCFKTEESNRVGDFWKFNNILIENKESVLQMEKVVLVTSNENIIDDQVKWEYFKYNFRKYTIKFSKKQAKSTNKKIVDLETKLKHSEKLCA